jgi:hypothetical protein
VSDDALGEFEQARREQGDRNEARNIRKHVNQARGDSHGAGARWPFELTQNAHDAGARDGKDWVGIKLTFDGKAVVYEHDGKPFTMQDLAALLSGGSSKDFKSDETTGRFGTGFLVTHVLSPEIRFEGVLAAKSGHEKVHILLNRAGEEQEIFSNTLKCYDAIRSAERLNTPSGHQTARFEYQTDNPEAARVGIAAFMEALPYLYGTCEHLGTVRVVEEGGGSWTFEPDKVEAKEFGGSHVSVRQFRIIGGASPRILSAVRFRRRHDSQASLVSVRERVGDRWRLCVPAAEFPRIFYRFPIRGSDFLPINAILDGRFDLRQERDRVLMKDTDKAQLAEALGLLPALVELGIQENWIDGHKLARVGMPDRAFGEKLDEQKDLREWWAQALAEAAGVASKMPIVRTSAGLVRAAGDAPRATFVVPRFSLGSPADELKYQSVWEVANEVRDVNPPILDIAADWTAITSEWKDLGIATRRIALSEIAADVRSGESALAGLKVTTEPLAWLAKFLNLVGEVSGQHNCDALLANLLPNQNKGLKSPTPLRRDAGISEELKDIAASIGRDVRERLLLKELVDAGAALPGLKLLLDGQIPHSLDESAVIKECIDELNRNLPDEKPIGAGKDNFKFAAVDLVKYLGLSQRSEVAQLAQQCPLVASDGSSVRYSAQRRMLAPVSTWGASAQPFADLYEANRVLAEDYVSRSAGSLAIVEALVRWGMSYAEPLSTDTPRELKDERLRAIAAEGVDTENATVTSLSLPQIALLPTQLIQRCQADEKLAKLLLGLTLKHVAVNDSSWRQTKQIPARRERADITIEAYPSLWLADLRSKAWVPGKSEKDGQQLLQPVFADAGNLKPLLDPAWLKDNDAAVELLSRFFGFNALELRLLSNIPSEADRARVEGDLAKIVQVLGGDPQKYDQLANGLATQQERDAQKERNKKFGLAVQAAIEGYLKARGLHLDFIDRGYDYDLHLEAPSVDAGTHHFRLAEYLLEVKATTTGEVRLTPAQAEMAATQVDRFVLCVVDLRGVSAERLEGDWTPADVEPRARIIGQVGSLTQESRSLVEQAKVCEVGIRNESALRYGVPTAVWQGGMKIATWIDGFPRPS